jgi:hypothetical protein
VSAADGFRLSDCEVHPSGLRTMPSSSVAQVRHKVSLPVCCPISKNPREGSTLTVVYQPAGSVLEVYSVVSVVNLFRGGFPGRGPYRAERNMEGMVDLLARMAADAVGVPVRVQADLVLDAGSMRVTAKAGPR